MSVIAIIPARYASSRFPGKPLAEIKGTSMIRRVYQQTIAAKHISDVIIATDDERIAEHAKSFGAKTVITRTDHPSGTDRCYEAYQLNGVKHDYVINVQGDEPFLDPAQIESLALACKEPVEIATQMIRCSDPQVLNDPGEVKIVLNSKNEALYFSRSVIPYVKGADPQSWPRQHVYYRHVGMYAYRTDILERISALQPSALEIAESLEQLRWLENGYRITCVETNYDSHCVDTPEDIEKVIRLMKLEL